MKRIIFCFLSAVLMLSILVSALQSEPDTQGNVVCSGASFQTSYNPAALNAVMRSISDEYLVSEGTNLVECLEDGSILLSYRIDLGSAAFIDFARIYGAVTANTAKERIVIENGGFEPLEFSADLRIMPLKSIVADSITIQFVKDAQQMLKPMFRISKDGVYNLGDIFFGCQNKDARGRAVNCEMSGQLFKERDAEDEYLTIAGNGFISESEGLQLYLNERPDNIEELMEEAGDAGFLAMPLSSLGQMRIGAAGRDNPLTITAKPAADGSSSFNYLKIKSGQIIEIKPAGELYLLRPLTEEVIIRPVDFFANEDIYVAADAQRVSSGQQKAFAVMSGCGGGYEGGLAKANVFIGNDKLVSSESCSATLIVPPLPRPSHAAFAAEVDWSYLRLNPDEKTMRLEPKGDLLTVWVLQGYETVDIGMERRRESAGLLDATIINPRNNVELHLTDEQIEITPEGKRLSDLGFNFNVRLYNVETGEFETLECSKAGECSLEGTRVFGITQVPLQEARGLPATGRRFEEGTKSAIPPLTACGTDRDCDATQRCLRRMCVEKETECLDARDCERGKICDRGVCAAPDEALGAEATEEEALEAEMQCRRCGDGAANLCDREECYGLGACYFIAGRAEVPLIGSIRTPFNKCHACATAETCDAFKADRALCETEQCASAAGLSCEWKDETCAAAEGAEGSAGIISQAGSIAFTASAAARGRRPDYGDYAQVGENREAMRSIVATARPSFVPMGQPTFSAGTVTATVFYVADCKDSAEWYTGLLDNPETMPECAGNEDCGAGRQCLDVEGKKRCKYTNACRIPPAQRGFYENVKCEGHGVCGNKVYNFEDIGREPNTGGERRTAQNEHASTSTRVIPERQRTLAVNPNAGTQCYIPYGSLVYLKFGEGNQLNGWYYAEDTGSGFRGQCKIDLYAGIGRAQFNSLVAMQGRASSPEVWVYPPRQAPASATLQPPIGAFSRSMNWLKGLFS